MRFCYVGGINIYPNTKTVYTPFKRVIMALHIWGVYTFLIAWTIHKEQTPFKRHLKAF